MNVCTMKVCFILFVIQLFFNFIITEAFRNHSILHRRKRTLGFKTFCYKQEGCFYTGPPFFKLPFRPLLRPPLPQKLIGTKFMLYTRKNKNNPFAFAPSKEESILRSNFDPTKMTRLIAHGYVDGSYVTSWMFEMKDVLLETGDDNVILVDFSTTNVYPGIDYRWSVSDIRLMGVQVAQLLNFLKDHFDYDMQKVHFIGHSLGAHMAGYTGEIIPNLGRITGLDPAGPYFRLTGPKVNLDTTDATYVDVIHSNPALNLLIGIGTTEDGGHTNFWPNGKRQRGQLSTYLRILLTGVFPSEIVRSVVVWMHQRSIELFIFSFNQNNCLFVGAECPSYGDFLDGKCDCGDEGEKCSVLGFYSIPRVRPNVRYYLKTGPQRPYCLHQYQVTIFIDTYSHIIESLLAKIEISIFGKHFIQETVQLNINLMEKQQTNTFLFTTNTAMDSIHTARISHLDTAFNSTIFDVELIKINYLFPVSRKHSEQFLCPNALKHKSHEIRTFSAKDCNWT